MINKETIEKGVLIDPRKYKLFGAGMLICIFILMVIVINSFNSKHHIELEAISTSAQEAKKDELAAIESRNKIDMRLNVANGRIIELEKQVQDNSKTLSRFEQNLTNKLNNLTKIQTDEKAYIPDADINKQLDVISTATYQEFK